VGLRNGFKEWVKKWFKEWLRNGWIIYYLGAFFVFHTYNIFTIFAPVIRNGWEYWRGLVRIITRGEYGRGLVIIITYKNGFCVFFF
jgi:hypothetical protein